MFGLYCLYNHSQFYLAKLYCSLTKQNRQMKSCLDILKILTVVWLNLMLDSSLGSDYMCTLKETQSIPFVQYDKTITCIEKVSYALYD